MHFRLLTPALSPTFNQYVYVDFFRKCKPILNTTIINFSYYIVYSAFLENADERLIPKTTYIDFVFLATSKVTMVMTTTMMTMMKVSQKTVNVTQVTARRVVTATKTMDTTWTPMVSLQLQQ